MFVGICEEITISEIVKLKPTLISLKSSVLVSISYSSVKMSHPFQIEDRWKGIFWWRGSHCKLQFVLGATNYSIPKLY